MQYKTVTCNNCHWVHMAVDEDHVKNWEAMWAEFWPKLDEEEKKAYGLPNGPPSKDEFLYCQRCGGSYLHFTDSQPGDCPDGSTISGILDRSFKNESDT